MHKNVPDYGLVTRAYYEQAQEVDNMPMGGIPHQRTSAFQARRRKQIELIQEVWPKYFPDSYPLSSIEARRMLKEAGTNSVTDILECLEHAAYYQHRGRGYVAEMENEQEGGWIILLATCLR
jgi:hypothetical protein